MIKILKKAGIPGLLMALALTACGTPDAVADELKQVSSMAGFAGNVGEAESILEEMGQKEEHHEQGAVSEAMGRTIDTLAAFLETKWKEEKIHNPGQFVEDQDEYYGDLSEESYELNTDDPAYCAYGSLKDWRSGQGETMYSGANYTILTASFAMTPAEGDEILAGLAEIGFEGLALPDESWDTSYCNVISKGVYFNISYLRDIKYCYEVYIEVLSYSIEYPAKYEDLMAEHMRDAFVPDHILCGGYLEYVQFAGSTEHPDNDYEKKVEIFFREGKPIQTNLSILPNKGGQEGELLTGPEKEDLAGLLTWLSGDADASQKFVAELGNTKDKKGTIGSLNWYQLSSLGSGEYAIRFQP